LGACFSPRFFLDFAEVRETRQSQWLRILPDRAHSHADLIAAVNGYQARTRKVALSIVFIQTSDC
jgi:hypothetical protein